MSSLAVRSSHLNSFTAVDFTVSRSGELLSRAPARTFHVATPLCLRLSCRLVPTSLPAQEASSSAILSIPKRAAASLAGAGEPWAPIRLVWALAQPRRSQLLARRRAARNSPKGSRRSRAHRPPSFRQLSHRARCFACTFSLPCQGL